MPNGRRQFRTCPRFNRAAIRQTRVLERLGKMIYRWAIFSKVSMAGTVFGNPTGILEPCGVSN